MIGTSGQSNPWRITAALESSYVTSGNVSFPGSVGKSDAQSLGAAVTSEIPVNNKWFVPVRLGTRNLFLGSVAGAPIPGQINTAGLDVGLGYRFDHGWTLASSIGPRFYRVDQMNGDDIGIGGTIRAAYKWRSNLTLALGVNFEADRQVPVLPAAGLRWDIRTNLTLTLMWPQPALLYRINQRVGVFLHGGGNFTVFRSDSNLGSNIGQPAFNGALGNYRDFHVGAGMEFRLWRGLSIHAECGYSFGREIGYKDINQTLSFADRPYVDAGLKYRF